MGYRNSLENFLPFAVAQPHSIEIFYNYNHTLIVQKTLYYLEYNFEIYSLNE